MTEQNFTAWLADNKAELKDIIGAARAGFAGGYAAALEQIGAGGVGDVSPVHAALSSRPVQGGKAADGFELWHLVYGALVQDGKPDTYGECEKAAKRIADMLQRRALSSAPAQPAREPMTEREILDLVPTLMPIGSDFELLWFARAIERHHGITKE